MKAICVASSNRPEYVRQFLASLNMTRYWQHDWYLFVAQEPTGDQGCWSASWSNSWRNQNVLGPEENTFKACQNAMLLPDCEALVYFDDDMQLSPDVITLCDWYIRQSHPDNYAGLCLCNEASDPSRPNSISPNDTWRGLVGQGYCYTRRQWEDFVKPNFHADNPEWKGHGYDWALAYRAQELDRVILRPRLSRTRHIGLVGFHGAAAGTHTEPFPEHIATEPCTDFVIENE